jgi:hypothetical protein
VVFLTRHWGGGELGGGGIYGFCRFQAGVWSGLVWPGLHWGLVMGSAHRSNSVRKGDTICDNG